MSLGRDWGNGRARVVSDPERAAAILSALRATSAQIDRASTKRRALVIEAKKLGVTDRALAEAAGVTNGTIQNWQKK
jgi:DNA-directed RNA polymerase specialized sigma24 family protein